MRKAIGCFVVVVLFASIGGVLGLMRANDWLSGIHVPWKPVSIPSGVQPDHFIPGDEPWLYVATEEGTVFGHPVHHKEVIPWQEVGEDTLELGEIFEYTRVGCGEENQFLASREIPDPPGTIVDQVDCYYRGHPEVSGAYRYVILEDGSIWRWGAFQQGLEGLGIILYYGSIGLGLGALTGLILFGVILWLYRQRGKQPAASVE
jgi:hypothetical protein